MPPSSAIANESKNARAWYSQLSPAIQLDLTQQIRYSLTESTQFVATRTANSPYTPVSRYQLHEPLVGIPPYYECHLIAEDGLFPTGASIVRPERHVHFWHLQTDSCARCWRFPPSGTSSPQFRSQSLIKYPRFRLLILHSEEFSAHSAGKHPFLHRVRECLRLFPYELLKELCRRIRHLERRRPALFATRKPPNG